MDDMSQTVLSLLSLDQNSLDNAKFNIDQIVCGFDKEWSKFTKCDPLCDLVPFV